MAALDLGRRGGERRNAAVGRVRNDRRPEGFDGAGAELAEERVVGPGAGVRCCGPGRTLLIVFSDLAFPLCGLFGRKKGLILQLPWTLERRGSGGVPDALEARMYAGTGALTPDERGNEAQGGH